MISISDLLSELEAVVTGVAAGAANSTTPLAAIDPAHPVTTAAIDSGMVAGKALAVAFPQAGLLGSIALQLAQGWANANAPAKFA